MRVSGRMGAVSRAVAACAVAALAVGCGSEAPVGRQADVYGPNVEREGTASWPNDGCEKPDADAEECGLDPNQPVHSGPRGPLIEPSEPFDPDDPNGAVLPPDLSRD